MIRDFWSNWKDEIKVVALLTCLFICIRASVIGFSITYNYQYCMAQARINTQYEFQWIFWGGCMIKLPSGLWIPANYVRFVDGQILINESPR